MSDAELELRRRYEAELDELYARLPDMKGCAGGCWRTCHNISANHLERERMSDSGVQLAPRIPDAERDRRKLAGEEMPNRCTALGPFGNCTRYAIRPFVCRLWGAADLPDQRMTRCPMGCEPERWLSLEEVVEIGTAINEVSNRYEAAVKKLRRNPHKS